MTKKYFDIKSFGEKAQKAIAPYEATAKVLHDALTIVDGKPVLDTDATAAIFTPEEIDVLTQADEVKHRVAVAGMAAFGSVLNDHYKDNPEMERVTIELPLNGKNTTDFIYTPKSKFTNPNDPTQVSFTHGSMVIKENRYEASHRRGDLKALANDLSSIAAKNMAA